jgi:hypothetical protein
VQITTDGNFHDGQYLKNTDPDDVSLIDGRAYTPPDSPYVTYLSGIKNSPEVSMIAPYR